MESLKTSTAIWRGVLTVHPAAELFPELEPKQLNELADDIRKNGLLQPVVFYKDADGSEIFVDLRNRLNALELLGWVKIVDGDIAVEGYPNGTWKSEDDRARIDPFGYVVGVNIRRRHLTAEQKRELVEKLIKADPAKSNRQIAATAAVSHPMVAARRADLEASGDVEKVSTSIDTLGRHQPARHEASSAGAVSATDIAVAESTEQAEPPADATPSNVAATGNMAKASGAKRASPPGSMHLHGDKVRSIVHDLHQLAANGMDVEPKEILVAAHSENKRRDLLGSARKVRHWLDALLTAASSEG